MGEMYRPTTAIWHILNDMIICQNIFKWILGKKSWGRFFLNEYELSDAPPPQKKAHFVSWDQESMYKSNEELSISSDVVKLHRLTKYLKGSQWDIL